MGCLVNKGVRCEVILSLLLKGTRCRRIGQELKVIKLKGTRWSRIGPGLKFVRLISLTKEYVIGSFWSGIKTSVVKFRGILTVHSH